MRPGVYSLPCSDQQTTHHQYTMVRPGALRGRRATQPQVLTLLPAFPLLSLYQLKQKPWIIHWMVPPSLPGEP